MFTISTRALRGMALRTVTKGPDMGPLESFAAVIKIAAFTIIDSFAVWLKGDRVTPVLEMTPVPFENAHGPHGAFWTVVNVA